MALLKKFAGETVIYGLGSVLPRMLLFLLTPYLTWIFDPSEFGVHGVMYSFTALLLVFFTYGMETALFRFGSKEGLLSKAFSTAAISLLTTTIVFVSLLFVFSDPIAEFLEEPESGIYVRWFALITGLDALSALPFAKLRLQNQPIRFAVIKILNVVIQIGLIVFFLQVCPWLIEQGVSAIEQVYDPDKKLDYVFLANLIASGLVLLVLIREFWAIKWEFDSALWKQMILYALPLIVVGLASVINRQLDRIFLKKLLLVNADYLTGIYNANIKIAVLMSLFITAFNYAAEPFFFKNADRSDTKKIYGLVAQAFSIVGSLVFLGILLYLDLIKYLIDSKYWSGLDVVPVLLLAYFGLGLFYNFSIWYKLTDNTRIGAWISVGGASITIVLNFILIPSQGIMGPAWAALACYIFMATVSYFIGKKYYPIDYPIGKMLSYISIAILFYGASMWIRPYLNENLIWILLVNTTILGTYLTGFYFFEKKTIQEFLNS